MSTEIRWRRGTTAEHSTFTGAPSEVTVDTDKNTLVVHDGATPGGFPLASESASMDKNIYDPQSIEDDSFDLSVHTGSLPQAQVTNLVSDLAGKVGVSDKNVFTKTQVWSKGADVASAAALTLGDDGNYFDVTGTTAITSIATVGVGTVIKLHFDGALTLTHHSTDLVLPGGANITTAAGDEAEFVEYATGDWRCTNYIRAAGLGNRLSVQSSGVITLSGTSTEMTGIPAGVQRLILSVDGVSISSGSALYIQLGSSSGYATSGYAGVEGRINGSTVGTGATASLGWLVSSANGVNGVGIYTLIKQSNGDWVIEGGATYGASSLHVFRGALTGVSLDVDRLKLVSGGTGTLSGKVSLMWEL